MSLFNSKDLAELTTNIMGDVTTSEHVPGHVVPQLLANFIAITVICVMLAFWGWCRALAVFVSVPVAFAIILLSRKIYGKLHQKHGGAKLAASGQVQVLFSAYLKYEVEGMLGTGMKGRQVLLLISVLVWAAVFCAACTTAAQQQPSFVAEPQSQSRDGLLGTIITLTIYGDVPQQVFDDCFAAVADIDARMSVNNPESELSQLGRAAGADAVAVGADTYALIQQALELGALSQGALDVSIGPVMELWKEEGQFCRLPAQQEIVAALPLVDYRRVELHEDNRVFLPEQGMRLDLGAIAKGYASDRMLQILQENDVQCALLDLGGNIYVHGTKPDGADWRVGIKSPLVDEGGLACVLTLRDQAVVTSGGYERFFQENGQTYHHILDPATGLPAQSGLLSVTIVAPTAAEADGLSTACFVLGLDAGLALLDELNCEGIFITADLAVYATDGLVDRLAIADERFQLTARED